MHTGIKLHLLAVLWWKVEVTQSISRGRVLKPAQCGDKYTLRGRLVLPHQDKQASYTFRSEEKIKSAENVNKIFNKTIKIT